MSRAGSGRRRGIVLAGTLIGLLGLAVPVLAGDACGMDGDPCDDGDACTDDDVCDDGDCVGVLNACVDENNANLNPCLEFACVDGDCVENTGPFDGFNCDDSNACTENLCQDGVCEVTNLNTCEEDNDDNDNPCSVFLCNQNNGICDEHALPDPGPPCDDENPCTVDDACVGGVCRGVRNTCETENAANTDPCLRFECVDGECVAVVLEDGDPCDDGNACTVVDTCQGGLCVSESLPCEPGEVCVDAECVPLAAAENTGPSGDLGCSDAADNDGDDLIDCADPDCRLAANCAEVVPFMGAGGRFALVLALAMAGVVVLTRRHA
ncbi:MAG: hypothetical protein AAF533_11235 [Acidobacteriota bacterium]